jgi:acyl-CoA thioesterase II
MPRTTGFWPPCSSPTGLTVRDPEMQVASLDHALWFHRPFRVDEWLLYDGQPGGRRRAGVRPGSIFTREGCWWPRRRRRG